MLNENLGNGQTKIGVTFTDKNGTSDIASSFLNQFNPEATNLSVSVNRTDGPDNCGNLPSNIIPYDPNDFTVPTSIDFDDENGDPQSLDVDVVYKPVVTNGDNQFVVPVSITFEDGSSLFGDINLNENNINVGPGNGAGDGVTGEPVELEPGEEPGDGEEIVGVRVTTTAVDLQQSGVTQLFSPTSTEVLYVPRLAVVLFEYDAQPGDGFGVGLDVKTDDAVLYSDGPAKSVDVWARQGVTFEVRLLVRPKTNGVCC